MLSQLFLALGFIASQSGVANGEVNRDQTIRILESAWSDYRDLEFIFEGEIYPFPGSTGSQDPSSKKKFNPIGSTYAYQGTFAWRHDASIHLDNYVQNADQTKPLSHRVTNFFGDLMSQQNQVPDRLRAPNPVKTRSAPIMSVNRPMSPLRFIQFSDIMTRINAFDWYYRFVGWENRGEQRLLIFDLANYPFELEGDKNHRRICVDLNNDALPVEIKVWSRGHLVQSVIISRTLFLKADDGKQLWIPIEARLESFDPDTSHPNTPDFVETYNVVGGTIRINQGLPDSRFRLDYKIKPVTQQIITAKTKFKSEVNTHHEQNLNPQVLLDRALAEADRQSQILEATSPARESWVARHAFSVVLGASFVLCLASLLIYQKRLSR